MTPSLVIDLYELTMAEAYRREAMAARPSTFSLFVRTVPPERGYLVAAGLEDALSWLENLPFGADELAAIDRLGLFEAGFLDWLADLRFTGTVRAVREGTIVFAHEPILEIDAPIGQAQLAETFLLNQITLQTVLATKAARCRHAAGGRAVVDFALRRTQGVDAGMKLARVAGLVGLASTSNVGGADRYGLAVNGTMAHSFVQAYRDETESFRAFTRIFGNKTVLLVDTYESRRGIERAIRVAGEARQRSVDIRGLRLDSGDLGDLARYARRRLDEEGLGGVQVFASGGLDEREIERLVHDEQAPIDGFGVGTAMGVSADAPTLDTVYKLVAFDGRPVRKTSTGKATWPCPKQVWRAPDWSGDTLATVDEPAPDVDHQPLLVEVMRDGHRTVPAITLDHMNGHFEQEWRRLPGRLKDLDSTPPYTVSISPRLRAIAEDVDRSASVQE
jgi:nicotinate phosphoribosyltransferase